MSKASDDAHITKLDASGGVRNHSLPSPKAHKALMKQYADEVEQARARLEQATDRCRRMPMTGWSP